MEPLSLALAVSLILAAVIYEKFIPKRRFVGQMAPSKLVVQNLPSNATKNDLEELFSRVGPLESVDFDSSNCGVVEFCSTKDAKEAMHQLNKTELKGKPINITWCEEQFPCSNAKLSLSIHGVTTDDKLNALFSGFGAVYPVELVWQHTDTSYWTVQFDSEMSATYAFERFNGAKYHDMKFHVSNYNDCKDLCVDYPKDLGKNDIQDVFSKYGFCNVNIEKDKDCKSRGICFVNYHTSEQAKKAMRNSNDLSGSHRLRVIDIVTQSMTKDDKGIVTQSVTKDDNAEEVPIFVIEGNRRQLVTTINMERFHTIPDFFQSLNKLGHDHGLFDGISSDSLWPGYEVVYKRVDSNKNEFVIKPFEDVEPCFNEDPRESSGLWFLGNVNKIEFYKGGVPFVDLNA